MIKVKLPFTSTDQGAKRQLKGKTTDENPKTPHSGPTRQHGHSRLCLVIEQMITVLSPTAFVFLPDRAWEER